MPPPRPLSRLRASGLSRSSPARGAACCSTSSARRRSSPTRGAAPGSGIAPRLPRLSAWRPGACAW
eukprot:6700986-Alexandrium_andersonii.AAC.1